MASGKQIAEKNFQTFLTCLASKVDSDFRQMVSRDLLSREEITQECGSLCQPLTKTPASRQPLRPLKTCLRVRGILPALDVNPLGKVGMELLDALGVEVAPLKPANPTPREERIIADIEDILRFNQANGRAPLHGEGRDIFERLYDVRLDPLFKLPEAQTLLAELDGPGLLSGAATTQADVDDLDEDALLAEQGIGDEPTDQNDIIVLRYVRSSVEKRAAEKIADRTPCADFDKFQPLFKRVARELKAGVRITLRFGRDTSMREGQ